MTHYTLVFQQLDGIPGEFEFCGVIRAFDLERLSDVDFMAQLISPETWCLSPAGRVVLHIAASPA
jgi:hypothetical protein